MKLHELAPSPGSTGVRKRVGRGIGSGLGKTSGYGHKGQKARSGRPRPGFEGGQMPMARRLPKWGFTNIWAKEYAEVNVASLDVFEDGSMVDFTALKAAGVLKKPLDGLKVLGNGEITKKLTVRAEKFSESARKKIEAAGGTVEIIAKEKAEPGAEAAGK